jgi:hypothetical protein
LPQHDNQQASIRHPDDEIPDVLPPVANQAMAALWLLLFGGRGLLVPALMAAGVVSAPQVARWDGGLLLQLYLLLLVVTLLVVALRAVRRAQAASASGASVGRGEPRD